MRGEYRRAKERAKKGDSKEYEELMARWGRERLESLLSEWRPLLVGSTDGVVRVGGNRGIILEVRLDDLPPASKSIVETLCRELKQQAQFASAAAEIGAAKIKHVRAAAAGASKGGTNSARPNRRKVDGLMRAQIRQGHDPSQYFDEWAREFDYSPRQLRNILKTVKETS